MARHLIDRLEKPALACCLALAGGYIGAGLVIEGIGRLAQHVGHAIDLTADWWLG